MVIFKIRNPYATFFSSISHFSPEESCFTLESEAMMWENASQLISNLYVPLKKENGAQPPGSATPQTYNMRVLSF